MVIWTGFSRAQEDRAIFVVLGGWYDFPPPLQIRSGEYILCYVGFEGGKRAWTLG